MRWSIEVLHILRKGRMKNVTDNKHNKYHWKGAPLVDSVLTFKFLWNFTSVEQLTFSAWKVVLILIISFSGIPLLGGAFYTLFVNAVESLLEISQCSALEVDIWTLDTFSKWWKVLMWSVQENSERNSVYTLLVKLSRSSLMPSMMRQQGRANITTTIALKMDDFLRNLGDDSLHSQTKKDIKFPGFTLS